MPHNIHSFSKYAAIHIQLQMTEKHSNENEKQ